MISSLTTLKVCLNTLPLRSRMNRMYLNLHQEFQRVEERRARRVWPWVAFLFPLFATAKEKEKEKKKKERRNKVEMIQSEMIEIERNLHNEKKMGIARD